jgi:hypothetical protein
MAKRITLESVQAQAQQWSAAFTEQSHFHTYGVNAKHAKQWIEDFTTQMYTLWQKHPRTWTKKTLGDTLCWAAPEWRVLVNTSVGERPLDVLNGYFEFLQAQGQLKNAQPLIASVDDCRWRLADKKDGSWYDTTLLLAQIAQLRQVTSFASYEDLGQFEDNHVPELFLMASGATISTLQRQVTFRTLPKTIAEMPEADLTQAFWQLIEQFSEDPKSEDQTALHAQFDAVLTQTDYSLSSVERLLLASVVAHVDLADDAASAAFIKDYQAFIRPASTYKATIKAFQQFRQHRGTLPIMKKVAEIAAAAQAGRSIDPALEAAFEAAPVKRPDGYSQYLDQYTYRDGDMAVHTLDTDAMDQAEAITTGGKPDEIIAATATTLKADPALLAATNYAINAGILVPSLVKYQSDIDEFLHAVQAQDYLAKHHIRLSMRDVDATLATFYNDMFLQTGRLPQRWTKAAVIAVMTDPDSFWQSVVKASWVDYANTLDAYWQWLGSGGGLKNAETLTNGLREVFQPAAPEADPQATLFATIARLSGDQKPAAGEEYAFGARHVVAVYLLGDYLPLQAMALAPLGHKPMDDDEGRYQYLRGWFLATVRPTITLSEAAALSGVSPLEQDYWEKVFVKLMNDQRPVDLNRRLAIAVQYALHRQTRPTVAELERFFMQYQPYLATINVDLPRLKSAVPTEIKMSKKAKQALKKLRHRH